MGARREGGLAMSRHHLARLLGSLAIAGLLVAPSARGELPAWDQAEVTALAKGLVPPLQALGADLGSRPSVPGKEKARAALMNEVELLQLRVVELAQRLASGAGRAETVALFREVETLQSRATKHSLEYPAPFDMHVHIDRVQRIMIQLARYYDETSGAGDGSHE
jgi:hypothetical protein